MNTTYTIYRKNKPDKAGLVKDLALLSFCGLFGLDLIDTWILGDAVGSSQKRDVLYTIKDDKGDVVYTNYNLEEQFSPRLNYNLKLEQVHEIKKFGKYELEIKATNTQSNTIAAIYRKKAGLNFFKGIINEIQIGKSLFSITQPSPLSKDYKTYRIKKRVNYFLFKRWPKAAESKIIEHEDYKDIWDSVVEINFTKKCDPFILSYFLVHVMIMDGDGVELGFL